MVQSDNTAVRHISYHMIPLRFKTSRLNGRGGSCADGIKGLEVTSKDKH